MFSQQARSPEDKGSQHVGTEPLAINNTLFRRCLTRLALKTTARFYPWNGSCVPLSRSLIVKTGFNANLAEAATLQFIAAKTSIPVPRVVCAFVRKGKTYIVMERIRAKTAAEAWAVLCEADRDRVLEHLRQLLVEMRKLIPPGEGVQSCLGGSLRDSRIFGRSKDRFGPFKTIQDFHLWLRDGFQPDSPMASQNVQYRDEIKEMISKQDAPWGLPVFTHGDLHPFNVLVRGTRVAGIIDWEFAGWYPKYWEYTSVWYGNHGTRLAWQREIPKFIEPDEYALEMEIIRQKWWGDF